MEHITEEYGAPANLMRCTEDEYSKITAMLAQIGVETRRVVAYGDTVTFQVRNNYRDDCLIFPHLTGAELFRMSSQAISDGGWQR